MLNSAHSLADTYEAITQERKQIYLHIYSLSFHTPVHLLRSSNTNLLTVLFACTALDARSFSVASPKIWNLLPPAAHFCNWSNTSAGTSRLITFSKPFHPPRYLPPCASDLAFADIVCVYKFCLLTYLQIIRASDKYWCNSQFLYGVQYSLAFSCQYIH